MSEIKRIIIVTGEASGDALAAHLIKALYLKNVKVKISGVGSQQMREAGADILLNSDKLSVVGIFEIFKKLNKILNAFFYLKKLFRQQAPDLLILVDYPGFNLRLAKIAKKMGIKVLYYASPQIWVWNYRRIYHIKKYVDHMMVLFPFEEQLYQQKNIPVTFVGHPVVDQAKPSLAKNEIYRQLSFDENAPIITLMPGSRDQEIKRLLPVMLQTSQLLLAKIPNAQFAIPLASSLKKADLQAYVAPYPSVRIIEKNTYNLLSISQAAIVASGTATLEVALLGVPMSIIYKLSPLTYPFVKLIARSKYVGLCNIIARKYVVKEFLQSNAKPKKITQEILNLLHDRAYYQSVTENLQKVRQKMGGTNSADRAAEVVVSLLER